MKGVSLTPLALVAATAAYAYNVDDGIYSEVHCKHFFYGYPTGTPATNDLIIRDAYALSSNDETKFADWVAYRLDCSMVTGESGLPRNWKNDPWLAPEETLERYPDDDYKDANADLGTERGHQAPLASFKGTTYWSETNYYSNITPQMEPLNGGPWGRIEERERDLAEAGNVVYVVTGPLYERDMPALPECDEPHRIPSGYWKVVAIQPTSNTDSIRVAAFIFDQDTPGDADVLDHLFTVDDIERRSGLDIFPALPDDVEPAIESYDFREWAEEEFG
ncbi:MAG: DNA/RNA non-specific endonuclease [Candidatus Zixiibacteriota bacterium]